MKNPTRTTPVIHMMLLTRWPQTKIKSRNKNGIEKSTLRSAQNYA